MVKEPFDVHPLDEEEADLDEMFAQLTEPPVSLLTPERRAELEAMAKATMVKLRLNGYPATADR